MRPFRVEILCGVGHFTKGRGEQLQINTHKIIEPTIYAGVDGVAVVCLSRYPVIKKYPLSFAETRRVFFFGYRGSAE